MPSQDQLSSEDLQALSAVQQHLYATGDPRAAKVWNYMVSQGYHPPAQQSGNSFIDTLGGNANWQKAIDEAAQTTPYSADKGILGNAGAFLNNLGAGATQLLLEPIAHPLRTVGGIANTAALPAQGGIQTPTGFHPVAPQSLGQTAAQATAMVPALALGKASEVTPAEAVDAAGTPLVKTGQAAQSVGSRLFPSFISGAPEDTLTQAVRGSVNKNNVGWRSDAPIAIRLMKSQEQQMGAPITTLDDAVAANIAAKKNVWNQVNQRLGASSQAGAMIDGNQIADAMVNSIDKRTATQNPALVQRIDTLADTYRRPIPVDEAEDFLESVNRQLNAYYAKNKVKQRVALDDPETAYTVAEGNALRSALNAKIDQLTGPGISQLKKAYGALTNVGNVLMDRQLVAARQAPLSLGEQVGTIAGAGQALKGAGKILIGQGGEGLADIAGGVGNVATGMAMKKLNSTDYLIAKTFRNARPAEPFLAPSFRTPQTERLLPSTSGAKTPLMAPDPGMTQGERVAALLHYLRTHQGQPALPAQASPIILPPPR